MAFAQNLRRVRLEHFLSQGELARRAGLHAVTLTRLEAGTTTPSTRSVRALAGALGVEPRMLAAPDEVAELRRLSRNATPADSRAGNRLDTWDDDGGAVRTDAVGHADRSSSRSEVGREPL